MVMKILMGSLFGACLMLAACGSNVTERAATGGLSGAVIAGPVGAVAGATVGAVTTPRNQLTEIP
jgi:outer membrane lipoprotein SlyB